MNQKFKEVFNLKASFFSRIKFFVIILLALLTSCISFKPNAEKSAKSLFTSFYLGEKGTQYFIKPLTLSNSNDESLKVDFTFRNKQSIDSNLVTFNTSVLLNSLASAIDSMVIKTMQNNYSITPVKLLYKEKKEEQFLYRTTSQVPLKTIMKLFAEETWQISTYTNGQEFNFQSSKKTNKSIPLLHSEVFEIMTIE